MSVLEPPANADHEINVSAPDEDGMITLTCSQGDFETIVTDPMFVDAVAKRHGILIGDIKLH